MVGGKFLGTDSSVPAGQDIVAGLLDRCVLWSKIVLERYMPLDLALTVISIMTLLDEV